MDKIMLGAMTTMSEVGVYENAEKINSLTSGIITALGTVESRLLKTLHGQVWWKWWLYVM